jgi:hypothetical protein
MPNLSGANSLGRSEADVLAVTFCRILSTEACEWRLNSVAHHIPLSSNRFSRWRTVHPRRENQYYS